jgi:hypothetical protein
VYSGLKWSTVDSVLYMLNECGALYCAYIRYLLILLNKRKIDRWYSKCLWSIEQRIQASACEITSVLISISGSGDRKSETRMWSGPLIRWTSTHALSQHGTPTHYCGASFWWVLCALGQPDFTDCVLIVFNLNPCSDSICNYSVVNSSYDISKMKHVLAY